VQAWKHLLGVSRYTFIIATEEASVKENGSFFVPARHLFFRFRPEGAMGGREGFFVKNEGKFPV
jgi:predicted Ser/Thr protein kinase